MGLGHRRSVRRHRAAVWLPVLAVAAAIAATVPSWLADLRSPDVWLVNGGMAMFTIVGTLIEDRRPGQAVGRICLWIGGLLMVTSLLQTAAVTLDSLPGRLPPLGAACAVISGALGGLAIFIAGPAHAASRDGNARWMRSRNVARTMTLQAVGMDDVRARSVRRHRALLGLTVAVATMALVGGIIRMRLSSISEPDWVIGLGMVVYTGVGALILDRRPGEPIGRLCLATGLLLTFSSVLGMIALVLIEVGVSSPIWAGLAVISWALFTLAILGSAPLLITRFPDGRVAGWRTRIVDAFVLGGVLLMVLVAVTRPGPLEYGWVPPVANPFAIPAIIDRDLSDRLEVVALVAYLLAFVLASAELVSRYRKATGLVRAQIRWFAAAIGVSLVLLVGLFTVPEPFNDFLWGAWILSLLLTPVAIAIAILRYHLYDIDRIISRTISYGLITALLVAVFLSVNLGLQSVLSSFTSGNSLAVAGSTLLAAALFTPVRRRFQRIVDRRFDRARYDGERTASAFSVRMRDATDLPTVAADLDLTVRRAISPSSLGLWLRGSGR